MAERGEKGKTALRLIAALKLLEAVTLVVVGVVAFQLIHEDLAQTIAGWAKAIGVDADNRFLVGVLSRLPMVTEGKLELLGVVTFCYAGLFATEGVGLLFRKRWAEYLTVITTALFLPVEIYELIQEASALKAALLLVNTVIVIYLIVLLWRQRHVIEG